MNKDDPTDEELMRAQVKRKPSELGIGRPRRAMPHGTQMAYKRHLRDGETPCPECRAAWRDHYREYRRNRAIREFEAELDRRARRHGRKRNEDD